MFNEYEARPVITHIGPLTEDERHQAYRIAQARAYHYATEFEESTDPTSRTRAERHALLWAKITNALRRDHV